MNGNAAIMLGVSIAVVVLYLIYLLVYNPETDRIPEAGHHE